MNACDPLPESQVRPIRFRSVRLGVLDVGSNTVHLLVVDARRGGHPTPMSSTKASLRLAESIDTSGKLTRRGADKLISTIMPKEDLGLKNFQHIHNAVLREYGNKLYVIAQAWNPGDFAILEQVN